MDELSDFYKTYSLFREVHIQFFSFMIQNAPCIYLAHKASNGRKIAEPLQTAKVILATPLDRLIFRIHEKRNWTSALSSGTAELILTLFRSRSLGMGDTQCCRPYIFLLRKQLGYPE